MLNWHSEVYRVATKSKPLSGIIIKSQWCSTWYLYLYLMSEYLLCSHIVSCSAASYEYLIYSWNNMCSIALVLNFRVPPSTLCLRRACWSVLGGHFFNRRLRSGDHHIFFSVSSGPYQASTNLQASSKVLCNYRWCIVGIYEPEIWWHTTARSGLQPAPPQARQ